MHNLFGGEAQGLFAGFGFTARKTMDQEEITMGYTTSAEAAKAVVRRITEEVQGNANFEVFDELFAKESSITPQPNTTPIWWVYANVIPIFVPHLIAGDRRLKQENSYGQTRRESSSRHGRQ